jgi:tRNA pseudouridine13 synthase
MLQLPYITADLPGVGGQLRATPEHFIVEEAPLYLPQGEGQHLYVSLTKTGLTTKEMQRQLERVLQLRAGDVGYAGLKDKVARTTQFFSISLDRRGSGQIDEIVKRITSELPVTVNSAQWHTNKLKAGHLLGNRFFITVSGLDISADEAQRRATAIVTQLQQSGAPNFFGPQRFGRDGGNIVKGQELLLEKRRVADRWLRRFLLSSVQSYLCNCYLAKRLAAGAFDRLLPGDVAKKYDTGGMFDVVDIDAEQVRYQAQQISFTAPLYGPKMWAAKGEAGELETSVLEEAGLSLAHFQRARVDGTRRLGRLLIADLQAKCSEAGLVVQFFLPKGAFATTVMRELMKTDLADMPELDGEDEP